MACFFFLTPNKKELQSAAMGSVGRRGEVPRDTRHGRLGKRLEPLVWPQGQASARAFINLLHTFPEHFLCLSAAPGAGSPGLSCGGCSHEELVSECSKQKGWSNDTEQHLCFILENVQGSMGPKAWKAGLAWGICQLAVFAQDVGPEACTAGWTWRWGGGEGEATPGRGVTRADTQTLAGSLYQNHAMSWHCSDQEGQLGLCVMAGRDARK